MFLACFKQFFLYLCLSLKERWSLFAMISGEIIQSFFSICGGFIPGYPPSLHSPLHPCRPIPKSTYAHIPSCTMVLESWRSIYGYRSCRKDRWPVLWPRNLKNIGITFISNEKGQMLKDWCWSSNALATWCEELTHWKRPWCWERLKAGGEGTTEDEMAGWHHRLNGHESD